MDNDRKIISSVIGSIGILTICTGSIFTGSFIISLIPLLWCADKVYDEYEAVDAFESESFNIDIKARVADLATKFRPRVADFSEYNPDNFKDLNVPIIYEKVLTLLDDILTGCDWERSTALLEDIDPRLQCQIVNKNNVNEKFPDTKWVVPIIVHDPIWVDRPTINTMILGVDTHISFITDIVMVSEYTG